MSDPMKSSYLSTNLGLIITLRVHSFRFSTTIIAINNTGKNQTPLPSQAARLYTIYHGYGGAASDATMVNLRGLRSGLGPAACLQLVSGKWLTQRYQRLSSYPIALLNHLKCWLTRKEPNLAYATMRSILAMADAGYPSQLYPCYGQDTSQLENAGIIIPRIHFAASLSMG